MTKRLKPQKRLLLSGQQAWKVKSRTEGLRVSQKVLGSLLLPHPASGGSCVSFACVYITLVCTSSHRFLLRDSCSSCTVWPWGQSGAVSSSQSHLLISLLQRHGMRLSAHLGNPRWSQRTKCGAQVNNACLIYKGLGSVLITEKERKHSTSLITSDEMISKGIMALHRTYP